MIPKSQLVLTVFAIIILFSGSISPSLLIQESNAMISKGTNLPQVHSDKVCGDQLCSVNNTLTLPKGQIIVPDNEKQQVNPDTSMLFVQTSGSGTYEEKDGKKILTFVYISPTTIYFSERPDRITGTLQTELFVALWGEGEDNFVDDPPNAALELIDENGERSIFIIELLSAMYHPEEEVLHYEIEILEEATEGLSHYNKHNQPEIPATFENSVLFIDSVVGDWFEGAGKYIKTNTIDTLTDKVTGLISPYVTKSAEFLCDVGSNLGSKIGGAKGEKLGCAVGTEVSMEAVGTFLSILTMPDIEYADPDALIFAKAIKTALTSSTSHDAVSLALMYNVFVEQGTNIENLFLTFMYGFRDNPGMTAAYDADNFCGLTNDNYFKNVLFPFFLYNLQHELYFTILDDLNNGMTLSQVQSDLDENLEDKIRLVITYSLVHLRDSCVDEDSDLYSLIYGSIDSTYKLNLVASSNSNGDTVSEFSSGLATYEAQKLAEELILNINMQMANMAAKVDTETLARQMAQLRLEATLSSELTSYGVDESSVASDIPVSSDAAVEAGFDTTITDMEDAINSEASSQIETFIEDPEAYMSNFESQLIEFKLETDLMLDDVVNDIVNDAADGAFEDAAEAAVEDAMESAAEAAAESSVGDVTGG